MSDYFTVSDGGRQIDDAVSRDDTTPLVVVIPGLTSDSHSPVSCIIYLCLLTCPHDHDLISSLLPCFVLLFVPT